MAANKSLNPFYLLLMVVGTAFALTACAYGVMAVKMLDPAQVQGENESSRYFVKFMDQHGMTVMLVELGLLAVSTVAAIASDGFWNRQEKRDAENRGVATHSAEGRTADEYADPQETPPAESRETESRETESGEPKPAAEGGVSGTPLSALRSLPGRGLTRRQPMKVQNYERVSSQAVEMEGSHGCTVRWLVSQSDGAPNFAMRQFEVAPGGHTPRHSHPYEHEVYVLEGSGVVMEGDTEHPLHAGDVVFVRPDEIHQFKNTGAAPLKFLCMVPNSASGKQVTVAPECGKE